MSITEDTLGPSPLISVIAPKRGIVSRMPPVAKKQPRLMKGLLLGKKLLFPAANVAAEEKTPEEIFGPMNRLLQSEPVFTETVTSDRLTVNLDFLHLLPGTADQGARAWDRQARAPYVESVKRWLQIIKGVKNQHHHELTIKVLVCDLGSYGNGVADIFEDTLNLDSGAAIPTEGYIAIHKRFYAQTDLPGNDDNQLDFEKEFKANILHKLGHIFGISSFWDLNQAHNRMIESDDRDWGTKGTFDSSYIYQNAADGAQIPHTSNQLMNHSLTLRHISLGLLDDLGWDVGYSATEPMRADAEDKAYPDHWH